MADKDMQDREYWDGLHQEESCLWGVQPQAALVECIYQLRPGTVLDLGASEGRNSLYLASLGFNVTAVDISCVALERLQALAQARRVLDRIDVVASDIGDYVFKEDFDNIVCTFTLHFLGQEKFFQLIESMQTYTSMGGVNVLADFTKNGPARRFGTHGYWPEAGELTEMYRMAGWEVLRDNIRNVLARDRDQYGDHYQQESYELVATKTI